MKITFFGATQNVTGSMFLIEYKDKKILVECGLYQGKRKESEELNRNFPFDPKTIDMLFVSHAHIDHSGNIPNLVKKGFKGNIYATHATCDLMDIMLKDSGYIHEKDIEYLNKKLAKRWESLKEPLYTVEDAENSVKYFNGKNYYVPIEIDNDLKVTFAEAGHILGSSQILFEYDGKTMLFTGDLGRKNLPIVRSPDIVDNVDVLITETTYGDRVHSNIDESQNELKKIIDESILKKGKIIVPAFSVGRTQEILFDLYNLLENKMIERINIFVDSPLSFRTTEVFRKHPECYDKETMEIINNNKSPFNFEGLRYTEFVDESKSINSINETCIIISASGMCEAGRILHHLKNNVENPNNSVIITGFMAQNTLGRRIMEKAEKIKIFGEEYNLKSKVFEITQYSAHADRNDLFKHYKAASPKKTFLLHGETDEQNSFKNMLESNGYSYIQIPSRGDSYDI